MITSALTIDVEDWFQVSNLEPYVPRDRWASFALTVERNVDTILALLSEKQIRATFFILGWIAHRVPSLVRKIAGEGHEIASHGWDHQRVSALSPAAFAEDVKRSREVLEQISAGPVLGYRAPSFSIDAERQWAHSILAEQGYQYSSSVAPFQHDHYGWPGAPRFAWRPLSGSPFLEVPVSTVRFGRWCLPAGGAVFSGSIPIPCRASCCVRSSAKASLLFSTSILGRWTRYCPGRRAALTSCTFAPTLIVLLCPPD